MTTKEKILAEIKDINYAYNDCSKYGTIKNLLDEMEEERKKGKWIDIGDYCVCNLCWHTEQQFNGVMPIPLHTPFCANCGADMREEKDDDN